MEEWKDITGYEGLYQVSNTGRVKSLNYNHTGKEKILKAGKSGNGYLLVGLFKDGKGKNYLVHRLVAQAFLENTDNLQEVNHKDENKQNNCVDNLEYCSRSYNITYNGRAKKVGKKLRGRKQSEETKKKRAEKMTNNPKLSKPVIGINKVSGLIVEFPSIMEAKRCTGIPHQNITNCCNGKRKSAGGYYWIYSDSEEVCDE